MSNQAASYVKKLLFDAFQQEASDIHFYPATQCNEVAIYYRVLGSRQLKQKISKAFYQLILTYFKFSAAMDIGETRRPQDGTMSWYINHTEYYELRLSTLPLHESESLTIRIFPQTNHFTLEELFLFPAQLTQMKKWLTKKAGLILFTGPTGSGKTTTMYALLQSLQQEQAYQIVTLEDPIERKLADIIQVEVNEKAGITYQTGLKAALRHDPDVLLIGEIRDEYTARQAVRAALTGHLVLSTLHAKDALSTLERLNDLGIQRHDLKQVLLAIAAMQLIPIKQFDIVNRRAAIVELLDEPLIKALLEGKTFAKEQFYTFQKLKEKAYIYGFITQETLENT